ncbi:TD and POZ domain-containing protein 1 [Argiope bruennichi]|uniref:TD and POZ domain-containing protein 1 n=1 Tax=Argiope bruennichi TaxID=94029 RepID=A0A8T0EHX8_ARGBR|nr:TD and POZ domain-containing protein 1 [Argiope bruennichi]
MSQQGLETVNYWNEIAAVSRNTAKLLKINWTIENMSTVNGTITGPEFYLEINCLCSILFNSGGNSDYYVFLVNKSDLNIKMQSHIIFLDSDGGVLHEQTMGTEFDVCKNSREKISTFSYSKSRLTSLKNDKLIIHCVIKVKGRNTTKINFLKSASESWKNLIDDWKKMFKNPVSSDFTLQVGDKIIRAHKTVLLARSAYFRRMFETEMREQAESTVHVTDVLYPTLQKLIEFLYTGSFSDTEDGNIQEIFDLYIAADKYNVVELRAVMWRKTVIRCHG